jgi:hypothetical protein
MHKWFLAPALVVLPLAFASPAAANQPTKTPYAVSFSGVATDICSFDIRFDSTASGTETDFVDKNGALTKIHVHQVEQDTFTANGKTLVGIPFAFNREILFDSNGNLTNDFGKGIFEKIPLPDGSLFISAGRADFAAHPGVGFLLSPDKGNPGNVAGFCAALSP